MNIFEHKGNQYQVLDGDFFGYKKNREVTCNMYPGDNCLVPLCMRPELSASAIESGISEDVIFTRSKTAEVSDESKPKTRKKKSKGPSISIF